VSFLIRCPNCGSRSVYEYRFGGEVKERPPLGATDDQWQSYTYTKANKAGEQTEWWFHRSGCREWMQARRNTVSNEVLKVWIPGDDPE
jgi:heterotetrameric sarcosine oxidase delta subunit